ncbi:MAG: serine/threonine protein kinase [Ktedonobacterales bacterium]
MPDNARNPLPIGTIVHERYRIIATVGHGGLGTVYQVVDILYGKRNVYALKELIDQSPGARKQFEMESQWLQSLDHNHIPKVREHFAWHQRMYLVMDFVDGENLEHKLMRQSDRPFSEEQALRWIMPVCDVLHYLHTRVPPILHRDVKPSNIIVTPEGHVVLVDLGIAKAHLPGANQTSTFVRKAGTEGYAPLEQYSATGQAGPWSDVYSLGATLYQLLTGHVPPTAVERIALDSILVPPQQANPGISAWVSAALLQALALRPGDRFQSVQEFAEALAGPAGRVASVLPANQWSSSHPPSYGTGAPRPNSIPSATHSTPPFASSAPGIDPPVPQGYPASGAPYVAAMPLTPPPRISEPALSQSTSQQLRERDRQKLAQLQAEVNATEPGGAHPVADEPERKHRRLRSPWIWGSLASVLVLVALVTGAVLYNAGAPPDRSNPQATVSGYFAAVQAQNYTLAWQYSAASYTDAESEASFIDSLRSDDAELGRVIQVDVSAMNVQRDSSGSATVLIDVTRAGSPDSPVAYTLILVLYNGSLWLIDTISTS